MANSGVDPGLATALAAALSAGGALTVALRAFAEWLARKDQRAIDRAVAGNAEIIDILQELQDKIGAGRVLLVSTSNGGNIPEPGKPLYSTIQFEIKDRGLPPIRMAFQNKLIDEAYSLMIRELHHKGEVVYDDIYAMSVGFLQELYELEGVVFAMIVSVKSTNNLFYFLSCRWYGLPPGEKAMIELALKSAATRIARLLPRR
jgi:hypothetical protein